VFALIRDTPGSSAMQSAAIQELYGKATEMNFAADGLNLRKGFHGVLHAFLQFRDFFLVFAQHAAQGRLSK